MGPGEILDAFALWVRRCAAASAPLERTTLATLRFPDASIPPAPTPTVGQTKLAESLDQQKLLAFYDQVVREQRAFLDRGGLFTIPKAVGPVRARTTPEGMIPLTGDGGSMNPNPLRWIFQDSGLCEGWAMCAEEVFWRAGDFGETPLASHRALASWRARIRRVVYDANIERGDWTLQQGADWKLGTPPGKAVVDADLMRSIQWPAQRSTRAARPIRRAIRRRIRALWRPLHRASAPQAPGRTVAASR